MNEQIDETRAPAVLPRFLPIGTQWTANRGGVNQYVFTLGSRAENDGGWIRGSEQWEISGDYVRIHPDYEILASGPPERTSIILNEIDWPSYWAALRSAPESREFKVGDRVSGIKIMDELTATKRVTGELTKLSHDGWCWRPPCSAVRSLDGTYGVHVSSLRHEPAQAEAKAEAWSCQWCEAKCGDRPDRCGICGTVRGCTQPPGKCAACNVPIASGERCVYCETRRWHHMLGRESNVRPSDIDERIAAAKAKHLADFDRAAKPKYTDHPGTWPADSEYFGQD